MEQLRLHGFRINLQLFAEKTEKPTVKRRQEAAKKGQIAKSSEINSVLVLLAGFLGVKFLAPGFADGWSVLTSDIFKLFGQKDFMIDYRVLQSILMMVMVFSAKILVPIVGGCLVAGLTASVVQTGFRFDVASVKFDLKNIDPVQGLKRIFSLQSLAELVKSIFKVLLVGYIAYIEVMKEFMNFSGLSEMNLRASTAFIGTVVLRVVFKIILWLVIIAIIDYIFQKWRNEKKMMMEKYEVKQEYKQVEGDPQIKGKIKQKQRQMSMMRMMQALPKADVVITNPTHFAVALQYDPATMLAPTVIAKGQDRIALKIRETAKEHDIVIVENKPLAQSLYFATEIGDAVPADLYQAVAEVLAFVYKLKGKI
ncbi:flagellar biosynthesis protein FlhB [Phosphitispora sp. TUW77]|uniref:flagellar biosynthesis protein FlhB n=1 Tax=Phosphitispora sp. TUW77 TaxID=3152361 RepID=UPI003AB5A8A7